MRILVVDDEQEMLDMIHLILADEFDVDTALDGEKALQQIFQKDYDLCLLDVMMPGLGGREVLQRLVTEKPDLPVVMLTARAEIQDRVEGLEEGADDYITKPFEPAELIARINAVLRRSARSKNLSRDGLAVDLRGRTLWVNGKEVAVTRTEFDLLATLTEHPGRAFSREDLLEKTRGVGYEGEDRMIDTHIKNLREKLRQAGADKDPIQTVWGYGYKWREG